MGEVTGASSGAPALQSSRPYDLAINVLIELAVRARCYERDDQFDERKYDDRTLMAKQAFDDLFWSMRDGVVWEVCDD